MVLTTLPPEVLREFDAGKPVSAANLSPDQALDVLEGKIGPGDSTTRPLIAAFSRMVDIMKSLLYVPPRVY